MSGRGRTVTNGVRYRSPATQLTPAAAAGRRETMKKMSIRKAGTVRLTSSSFYNITCWII
ncbi:MAG TPA: hypothetical protein VFQ44_31060 [Streptosporangiaceae bacterium]|nr:hypothetical protein [Streptosporangiaceae bacterium]